MCSTSLLITQTSTLPHTARPHALRVPKRRRYPYVKMRLRWAFLPGVLFVADNPLGPYHALAKHFRAIGRGERWQSTLLLHCPRGTALLRSNHPGVYHAAASHPSTLPIPQSPTANVRTRCHRGSERDVEIQIPPPTGRLQDCHAPLVRARDTLSAKGIVTRLSRAETLME